MTTAPSAPRVDAALVLDAVGEAIVAVDAADVVCFWNRGAEALFGWSAGEMLGRPFALVVPPERVAAGELAAARARVAETGACLLETEGVHRSGRRLALGGTRTAVVDGQGRTVAHCLVLRDVGQQRAVAHRLYESEKLAALRAMAVGVAHELGNPLAGALGLLQLVERRTREPETRARLAEAQDVVSRAGRIVRELTDFTRADGAQGTIDVNEVLRETVVLARYAHEAAPVEVELLTDAGVPPLLGSRNHLVQACLHLVMNAYDAMLPAGGRLTITSEHAGDEVVLRFADTGRGIPDEIRTRLFAPFVTTKPEGRGTGLGLYVCHGIVTHEFGGTIAAESTVGAGSCFTMRLPCRAPAR